MRGGDLQRIGRIIPRWRVSAAARRENFDTPPLIGSCRATWVAPRLPRRINNLRKRGSSAATESFADEEGFMADDHGTLPFDNGNLRARERRTQTVSTKMTQEEEGELQRASSTKGKKMSEWVREALLQAARRKAPSSGHEPFVLTEVVGIQLFLMNVLSPLSRGEHLTPEQYQTIIKSVQTSKSRVTEELVAKRLGVNEK